MRWCRQSSESFTATHKIKHWGKVRSADTKTQLLVFADYQDKYAEEKIFTVIFQGELEAVAKIIHMNM